jgi:hypothetical protein
MRRVPVAPEPVRRVAFFGIGRRVAGIGHGDLRAMQRQRPRDPCRFPQRRAAKGRPTCHRPVRPVGQRVDPDEPRAAVTQPSPPQRPVPARRDRRRPGGLQPASTAASVSNTCQPRSSQLTSPPPCAAC